MLSRHPLARDLGLAILMGVALVGGLLALVLLTDGGNRATPTVPAAPAHQGARSFHSAQATTVACDDAHVYVGCTLTLNGPRWTNTGQARSFSAAARAALCTTTISGAHYVSTGYPASSRWRKAIDGFFAADFLSQPTQDAGWLSAHDALLATTVSGLKYCANRAKYAGGKWDQAFATVATIEAFLGQNPLVTQPPKPTASGTVATP